MKTPIIFFGASVFVTPVIQLLQEHYDLKLVITTELNPTDAIPQFCKKNNIPCIAIKNFQDSLWETWKPKIISWKLQAAVLAYFGLIVPKHIIDLFPKGIVNIHPSLLPAYRGTTPGQTALLLGDAKTGVSIMLLDKEVDHGPVLAQQEEIIDQQDTSVSLYKRLFAKGVQLLETVLPSYLLGEIQPIAQDHSKATFTKALTRESGFVDASKPTSGQLFDRMIRAYYPWPGVWTKWHMAKDTVRIVKFLPGEMVQMEGKKPMRYKDFINGYPGGKAFLENFLNKPTR